MIGTEYWKQKKLKRDHRIITKEIKNISKTRKTFLKNIIKSDLRKFKRLRSKESGLTSKKIFEEAGKDAEY